MHFNAFGSVGPFEREKKLPPEIQANKEKYYAADSAERSV
jgi:hypothetical protein